MYEDEHSLTPAKLFHSCIWLLGVQHSLGIGSVKALIEHRTCTGTCSNEALRDPSAKRLDTDTAAAIATHMTWGLQARSCWMISARHFKESNSSCRRDGKWKHLLSGFHWPLASTCPRAEASPYLLSLSLYNWFAPNGTPAQTFQTFDQKYKTSPVLY